MLINNNLTKLGLAMAGVLLSGAAGAQGLGNSPYSRLGIGDYNPNLGGVRQMGMGGVGLAAPNAVNVNELNPALLYYTARTTFEAGYTGQYKTVQNATAQNRSGSGTLGYLALAVPLSPRWGAAVGLKPLSAVDYESNVIQEIAGTSGSARSYNQRQGTGGVAEAYFAQGLRLTKSLSVGASASYVFGTVDETQAATLQLVDGSVTDRLVSRFQQHYSDFSFRGGLHYRHKLSEQLRLNLGGVYTFRSTLNGTRTETQEREDANGALTEEPTVKSEVRGLTTVPALAQVGISLDNDKNWSLSLDGAHQQWSKYSGLNPDQPALRDTWRVGLGGEITPEPGSVEHYFRRVSYRAGLSLAQMPYATNGQTLYDRAVSWGFAFPLPTATPLEATTFSLGFTYGVRGNTATVPGGSNVQESYIRGQLGITLNNRWFIKRRLL